MTALQCPTVVSTLLRCARWLAVGLLFVLVPSGFAAAETEAERWARFYPRGDYAVLEVRGIVPLATQVLVEGPAEPDTPDVFFGVQAGIEIIPLDGWLTFDVGIAAEVITSIDADRTAFHTWLRAGSVLGAGDSRNHRGEGFVVQFEGLFGYDYAHLNDLVAENTTVHAAVHSLTATAALDSTWWLSARFGLTLQLALTFGFPVHQHDDAVCQGEAPNHLQVDWFAEPRISVGLAFGI